MTLFQNWRRRDRHETEPLTVAPFDWMRAFFRGEDLPALFEERRLPRADVAETDRDFLITLELPGFDVKDVEIRCAGHQLVVRGERKQEHEDDKKHYHRVETRYGAFERRFEMPAETCTDTEAVEAMFRKGMLEIRVPKREQKPVAKIPIKTG